MRRRRSSRQDPPALRRLVRAAPSKAAYASFLRVRGRGEVLPRTDRSGFRTGPDATILEHRPPRNGASGIDLHGRVRWSSATMDLGPRRRLIGPRGGMQRAFRLLPRLLLIASLLASVAAGVLWFRARRGRPPE